MMGAMVIGRTEGEMKVTGETEMTEEVMERTELRIQDGGEMKIRTRVRRGGRNLARRVNGGKTPHPVTPVTRYSPIRIMCHPHLCSTNVIFQICSDVHGTIEDVPESIHAQTNALHLVLFVHSIKTDCHLHRVQAGG